MEIELLDPTAEFAASEARPARSLDDLRGKTIGLLDNGKWNSDRLLEAVVERLAARYGAEPGLHCSKRQYNTEVSPEVRSELALTSDGMVVAIGD